MKWIVVALFLSSCTHIVCKEGDIDVYVYEQKVVAKCKMSDNYIELSTSNGKVVMPYDDKSEK